MNKRDDLLKQLITVIGKHGPMASIDAIAKISSVKSKDSDSVLLSIFKNHGGFFEIAGLIHSGKQGRPREKLALTPSGRLLLRCVHDDEIFSIVMAALWGTDARWGTDAEKVASEPLKTAKERREMLMAQNVSSLEISTRARNTLARLKIKTIGDLTAISADELLQQRGFGHKSLGEIREALLNRGLMLASDSAVQV